MQTTHMNELARELRIGNIITGVYFDEFENEQTVECTVMAVDGTGETMNNGWFIMVDSAESIEYFYDFRPIAITAEKLDEYGYKKIRGRWFILGALKLEHMNEYWRLTIAGHFVCNIKYVHQIQNLYRVVAGKELVRHKVSPINS